MARWNKAYRFGFTQGRSISVKSEEFNDRLLLKKACRQACRDSLMLVYQKYRKSICDFLKSREADRLAEDICQEVFCRIYEGRCSYDGSSDVKSYLFGIAKNIHIQERKALSKWSCLYADLKVERNVPANSDVPQSSQIPESLESYNLLARKIADLPPKSSEAVELVYLEGIPTRKAARIANCDIRTFRTRLGYGLNRLRKYLKKDSS